MRLFRRCWFKWTQEACGNSDSHSNNGCKYDKRVYAIDLKQQTRLPYLSDTIFTGAVKQASATTFSCHLPQ